CLPAGFPPVPQYPLRTVASPHPSQNRACATHAHGSSTTRFQACLRPRDRFWDIPVPKIDSAFDNLLVPQPSWSPSTTQQLRKLVAAPYLTPI
ncbi:hypothetical protein, partial [Thiolapillus sp.]|uniref:hypothetical protein n=1 Tax=Thiolapillus sp. TaxID=2017437 RepID=UPI003AF4E9FB